MDRPALRTSERTDGPRRQGLFVVGLFGRDAPPDRPPETVPPPAPGDGPPAPPSPLAPEPRARASHSARAVGRRRRESDRPFRGAAVRSVPAGDRRADLDWPETLRRAAPRQRHRRGPLAVQLTPDDLWRKRRQHRPRRLLLLAVDVSGSMGGALMDLARRTALRLLDQAYLDRDPVALVAFREQRAELLLPPTRHPAQAQRRLLSLACGGTTPLAAGLQLAGRTLAGAARRADAGDAALLVISDGRANVSARPGLAALEAELQREAGALARRPHLQRLLLDTTARGKDPRPAERLARWLDAEHLRLWQLERAGVDPVERLVAALA